MNKVTKSPACFHWSLLSRLAVLLIAGLFSAPLFAQTTIPSATLQQLAFIGLPTWTTSGSTAASFDEPAFNRVTGVMYLADRPNFGATAIDTKTLTYLGTVELPGCRTTTGCSPSGALVAPDLQKLIVTDRLTNIYIFDLRAPGSSPAILKGPAGQDELDYDPINQRVYIGNTTSDFAITVVDLKNNKVLGSIPVTAAPEQPRFNPVDGLIYVSLPTVGLVVIDPDKGSFGQIVNTLPFPSTCPDSSRAFDIDPTTNTAYWGCSTGPQNVVDVRNGSVLQSIPLTGEDIAFFNPHNRRWYAAMDNRSTPATTTIPCPKGSDGRTGTLAVISNAPTQGQFMGVVCVGRGAARAGIDTINNNIFVPIIQFPADPASADTGRPGILVFHDAAPDVFGVAAGSLQSWTTAALAASNGSGVTGTVAISLRRRSMFVDAALSGLPANSNSTLLVVTTSAGNETINCGVSASGQGFCQGDLVGDPLIGGVIWVGSGGNRVASGTLTSVATFPTFIPTD